MDHSKHAWINPKQTVRHCGMREGELRGISQIILAESPSVSASPSLSSISAPPSLKSSCNPGGGDGGGGCEGGTEGEGGLSSNSILPRPPEILCIRWKLQ